MPPPADDAPSLASASLPVDAPEAPRLVIVTGLSGAGRSQVMKSLEDLGYLCVDNLPPALIEPLLDVAARAAVGRLAIAPDVRTRGAFGDPVAALDALREAGVRFELLFLDAADDVLVRRYSETRRRHPLGGARHVSEAIHAEREALAALQSRADLRWDTSTANHATLTRRAAAAFDAAREARLTVSIIAFGYKYGLPLDADLVFDVRFLANPYYEPALRELTGADAEVAAFLEALTETAPLLERLLGLLDFLVPQYLAEGKAHLTIAIGCTGGRHRSVYVGRRVAEALRANAALAVQFETRDLGR